VSSRRRLPTAAERASRLRQFRPGHVAGRVASAQPILRSKGTLRRPAVGGAGVAPGVTGVGFVRNTLTTPAVTNTFDIYWSSGVRAGELLVVFMAGPWVSLSAGTGWTTFVSGSTGPMHWHGMWRIAAADLAPGSNYGTIDVTYSHAFMEYMAGSGWRLAPAGSLTPTATVETMTGYGPWTMLAAEDATAMQVMAFIDGAHLTTVDVVRDGGTTFPYLNEGNSDLQDVITPSEIHYGKFLWTSHFGGRGAYPSSLPIDMVSDNTTTPLSGTWLRARVDLS
jgi:hypothetical protein